MAYDYSKNNYKSSKSNLDNTYTYYKGWRRLFHNKNNAATEFLKDDNKQYKDDEGYLGYNYDISSPEVLAELFREEFYGPNEDNVPEFLREMDDETLAAFILDNYSSGKKNKKTLDLKGAYDDIQALLNSNYMADEAPDYAKILQDAEATINAENAEVEAMYNQLLAQQTEGFQNQLADNNKAYNDMSKQILSNDYMQNTQILGGLQTQMDRSSRNALEAGASAGLRLAGNINTLLSVQNQQASKSLETSNQLAQMLLNQRQAAAGIRGDYMNSQAQNTANRANLRKGNAERINSYANSQFDTQQRVYDQQQQAYNEAFDSKFADNVFADAYKSYKKGQTYDNKYGY